MTTKQDKLPTLDPSVRGIFDRILETVAEVRRERKSEVWRLEAQRIEAAEVRRREAVAFEAKADAQRKLIAAREKKPVGVIQFRDETGTLVLKEGIPRFVR